MTDEHVTDAMRRAIDLTTGFIIDPEVLVEFHRALHRKGWSVPHWPVEHGGTGWTPVPRYLRHRASFVCRFRTIR